MTLHIVEKTSAAEHSGSRRQRILKDKCQLIVTNSGHCNATSRSSTFGIEPDGMTLAFINTEIHSQARSTEAIKRDLALRIKRSNAGSSRRCC